MLLNRAGLSAYEARHVRPGWEVRALLMNVVAEAELRREEAEGIDNAPYNPPDTPAPAWVDDLPT